jgi:ketosteroid isomerase-like protein
MNAAESPDRLLADEAQIRRVLRLYARGVDRLDLELVRSCYFDDAIEDRGRYVGDVDGFIEWMGGLLGELESTWHLLGEPLIEIEGDVAWVESYSLAHHGGGRDDAGERVDRLIPCRYCDRFERRQGRWLIAHRLGIYEAAFAVTRDPSFKAESLARRGKDDPSYRRP